MFSVRRSGLATLAAAVAFSTAACGDAGPTSEARTGSRTVTDATGKPITVPARPERILPLSEPTLDATLALGITPIATTAGRGQNAIPSYLASRSKGIRSVGSLGAPNLEQVAELAPDVILLDGTAFQDAAVVDKLRQIAPVASVSEDSTDWQGSLHKTAEILGRPEEGAQVLQSYEDRVASVKASLGDRAADTVSIVRWSGIGLPAMLMKELTAGRVLTDLGLSRPASQDRIGPGHTVPVSLEEIERLDADWIFFGALGAGSAEAGAVDLPADVGSAKTAIQTARDTPGFTRLQAVRDGQVVPVDGSAWTSAGGPLAAGVVLDDVARTLGG